MKLSGTAIAIALYVLAAWRTSGWRGLVGSIGLVSCVAFARAVEAVEKDIDRNYAFWLDLIYWSILFVPFFLK